MPPRKRWTVTLIGPGHMSPTESYGSQSAAYDAVSAAREALADGSSTATVAKVKCWEDGRWRLFERVNLVDVGPNLPTMKGN